MSLLGFLLNGEVGERSSHSLRTQLLTPWGWPVDAALQELALKHGVAPVSAARSGEILLVGVHVDGLWVLAPRTGANLGIEFRGTAAVSARLAQRIVTRDLPFYSELSALHREVDWSATLFALPGKECPVALDGESFGLGFALATASRILGLPVRADLIASAALDHDGTLRPVEEIGRKVGLVLQEAPGVRVFLVEASQRGEAEDARAKILRQYHQNPEPAWLTIVPVSTFRDAFAYVFPDALAQMRMRWQDPPRARKLGDELFRTAIYGSPLVLSWRAVAEIAKELSGLLAGDEVTVLRLKRVRAVAERHDGAGIRALLEWPSERELTGLHHFLRSHLLAQVVQSAADGGEDPVSYARKALRFVRSPTDCSHEDLVLLGAIGRAFAAGGAYDEAALLLREAVDGWKEIDAEHESSFALCELVRLLALARDRASVEEICAKHVSDFCRLPRASELSQGFVRVAAGKSLVQVGSFGAALDYLDDNRRWPPLPMHLEAARIRWLARSLDGVGNPAEAQRHREELQALGDVDHPLLAQSLLAQLDEALAYGTPTEQILTRLGAIDEVRRVLARCPDDRQSAIFLAEHYRY